MGRKYMAAFVEALTSPELDQLSLLLEKIYRYQADEAAEATLATLGEETDSCCP